MALQSDLTINAEKFSPSSTLEKTEATNKQIEKIWASIPRWYEVGARKYREMRANGETGTPAPKVLEEGKDIAVPSREPGRTINCRTFSPSSGKSRGVFYHIHGGGWVLQSEFTSDEYLKYMADQCQLTAVSVGYRLAPEHTFPAGNEDCYDVADWLVDNAEKEFGAPLAFIGGESAGAHLSSLTTFHLAESRPSFKLRGVLLSYGVFSLVPLPQQTHFKRNLSLTPDVMAKFIDTYVPNTTFEQRQDRWKSPLYAPLHEMKLPPALFSCGTEDPLLDDTMFMSTKWLMSGAKAIVKIHPGAPHAFSFFPHDASPETTECWHNMVAFVKEVI